MTLEEAEASLKLCTRTVLDNPVGGKDIFWQQGFNDVAEGHFGERVQFVLVYDEKEQKWCEFKGANAQKLEMLGTS